MTEPPEQQWADPVSLLGLLQRGRGAGYRQAILAPQKAVDRVVECVADDPRWDHQVEDRGWFYAGLVAELGVDLARLRAAFDQPPHEGGDDAAWIALSVFELSARRGIPGAMNELRRYLRSGRDAELALEHILPAATLSESGLLEEILEFADATQLRESMWAVEDLNVSPWPEWRRASSVVDAAVATVLEWRRTPRAAPADWARGRNEQLRSVLVQKGSEASPGTPLASLTALADGQDNALLGVAATLLNDPSLRGIVHVATRHTLWNLTSPSALTWARSMASEDTEGGWAALQLFARLAEPGDLPKLRQLLERAVALGDDGIRAQCSVVEALGRLRDGESVAVIESLFETTVYSYLRSRCAEALSVTASDFRSRLAIECLWDCEPAARLLAVQTAARGSPTVDIRLAQMANDVTEDEACRRSARGSV
jgi:hypothetical protein